MIWQLSWQFSLRLWRQNGCLIECSSSKALTWTLKQIPQKLPQYFAKFPILITKIYRKELTSLSREIIFAVWSLKYETISSCLFETYLCLRIFSCRDNCIILRLDCLIKNCDNWKFLYPLEISMNKYDVESKSSFYRNSSLHETKCTVKFIIKFFYV